LGVAGVVLPSAASAAGVPCEDVAKSIRLSRAAAVVSQPVAAGAFTPPGRGGGRGGGFAALPAFCRVTATLQPTRESNIGIEVWLPEQGWNGKLQVVGNGAFAGTIGHAALATALAAGYVAAGTDTGHTGAAANTFSHENVLVDFAHRAIHETTVAARAAIDARFGTAPKFAYFNGCSTGGRQAVAAAQRYPADFDGIVAGAPATHTSTQVFSQILFHQVLSNPASALPRESLTLLHGAVLQACDGQDGAKDGVLERPLACRFEPQVLACKAGDAAGSCLTPAQVEAVTRIYGGARHERTGASIFPGLERGSEAGWSPGPISYAVDWLKYRVFRNPAWDPATLDYGRSVELSTRRENRLLDAADPDLSRFTSRRGKLLMYQGWAEPGIPPRNIVRYYGDVQKQTKQAADSVRLFMVAGMGHCGGGDGASSFDMLAALDAWVVSGRPPDSIPASRVRDGRTDRTRPLCAYPNYAHYRGSGSLDEAVNFECRAEPEASAAGTR
jgi:feruloyl esterase